MLTFRCFGHAHFMREQSSLCHVFTVLKRFELDFGQFFWNVSCLPSSISYQLGYFPVNHFCLMKTTSRQVSFPERKNLECEEEGLKSVVAGEEEVEESWVQL